MNTSVIQEPKLISLGEASRSIGISIFTMRRMVASGAIHSLRVGGRIMIQREVLAKICEHGVSLRPTKKAV